ncbi:formate hydrogenlyase subunit 6/NADH:ubiquinone oxidoreductase subunit I [Lewinella aquimaris]|uniref:Formate hydrogenlyase subunit 6/NADH:ubiquinone oxidoreductase subunit I n=1 Tax=Neolewinella aquimaris TaxID=1835722 RepID=A0A840DXR7_9BACT|nr:4Fe-4S binding protein [Neolewinella aquimaris]MBB4077781.1 formate hydrogenlyase subunit 6/NADH:ubiquinone oxidoreductase subunit I [Neolewinella aquimaris]
MSKLQPVLFNIGWNACINCGACVAICPQEAGFVSPFDTIAVDRPCDIACLLCEQICPVETITHVPVERLNGSAVAVDR